MPHLVLLGDSILDNGAYVGDGPAVIQQVQAALPTGWQATLLAVDGSVTRDVDRQLVRLPAGASHAIVSVGGNDALWHSSILQDRAQSVAEVLSRLAAIAEQFERDYHEMVQTVLEHKLAPALCTIYYPNYPDAAIQRIAVAGLTIFNDCIIRTAIGAGLPLLDLRLICNASTDYANPIEPSVAGGAKIAQVISKVVMWYDFTQRRTEVFI